MSLRIRASAVPACLAILLAAPIALSAQLDCSVSGEEWNDIRLFRQCLAERGLEAWEDNDIGRTVLHNAALQTENPTVIVLLLDAGANPNARDDDGNTPLRLGALNTNPMVTSHLLDAGADPNAADNNGYGPLHSAVEHNLRVAQLLLDAGADPNAAANDGYTPLHHTVLNNVRVTQLLLEAGASPTTVSHDGWTALQTAVFFGNRGVVPALLQAGAGATLTLLHRAVLQSDAAAVASLLGERADPAATDAHGWNALHFAVPIANSEILSQLLQSGMDPDTKTTNGLSALHLAADSATVLALLNEGADVEARNDLSRTPLHQASTFREAEVVEALLNAGADVRARDNDGERPMDLAARNGLLVGSDVLRRLEVPDE